MTLESFNQLDFKQKWVFIFKNPGADLVGFRRYYGQKMVLFDCGGFFAETISDPEIKKITKIEGFASDDDKRIDPYLGFMKDFVSNIDQE